MNTRFILMFLRAKVSLFVFSTLALIGLVIYVLIEGKHFTAFHPVNIVWYVFLVLKLRLDRQNRINRRKDGMF